MAAVLTGQHGRVKVRPVRVGGVVAIKVFCWNLVVAFAFWENEFSFPMRSPNPQSTTFQSLKHNGFTRLDGNSCKMTLKLP